MPSIEEQAESGVLKAVQSPGFIEKLTAVFKGGGTSEVTELRTSIAGKDTEITKLKGEATASEGKITKLTADLGTANATIAAKDAEITKLKGEAKTVDEAAAVKAQDIVAGQGVPSKDLPDTKSGAGDKAAAARKQYADLLAKGDSLEAGKFYAKNKELLWQQS